MWNHIRFIRPDDLLVLDIHLTNLRPSADGKDLERIDHDQPAWLAFEVAPQHVAERVHSIESQSKPGPPPVATLAAGASRLVFRLPTDQASVPFTLAGLLDWASLVPSLAPGALPPGTTRGPAPRAPGVEDTFIEFPYRLLISPVGEIGWVHPIEPITRNGRTELWHTKAVSTHTEPANPNPGPVPIRVLYVRPGTDLKNFFPWSMTSEELRDLVTLTSDFSNKPRPPGNEIAVPMRWRVKVDQLKKAGKLDIPPPATLEGRQVVLTSLGASMDLRGSFAFPRDDQDPGELKEVGITVPNLLHYVHVAGLGRDQHVEVVKRGFVDTGHRAVLFRVTHREYEPEVLGKRVGLDGPYGVFGTIGYLRQYEQIIITQPTLDYEALRGGYPHDGREMPLRSIEFTTLVSPELAASNSKNAFWLRDEQGDVAFDFVATDWRGRRISSSRPLMFIPHEAVGNVDKVEEEFNKGPARRRTAPLYGQTFALADPSQTNPDSTSGPVESLTLSVSRRKPGGRLPDDYLPSWVIHLALAQITLEPLQRLTGSGEVHRVELAAKYLDHGLDPAGNPTGAFVRLKDGAAKVEMSARDGGGLSAPAMALDTISAHAGLTSSKLAAGLTSKDLSDLFGDMKLFGTVPLTKLLGQIPSATAELFAKAGRSDEELDALANDPSERLEIPILRCRVLRDSNHRPIATITRFLWKPVLATSAINLKPAFDLGNATFLLDVLSTTPLDGSSPTVRVRGEVRGLSMTFAQVARLDFGMLRFLTLPGRKPDVTAEGVSLHFIGALQFVDTLRDLLPMNGFSDPPAITIDEQGISSGFSLAIPSIGVGVFSLQNLVLSASLSVPFVGKPAGLRFALSERHHPFLVTVTLFGGGGFFALTVRANGVEEVEASIEFGGNVSLNLGVASGGVYVMAGVYFGMTQQETQLTGFLRMGGYLSVLGLITVSLEFYLAFTWRSKGGGRSEIWGQASLTINVEVAMVSKSVTLTVERRFAGAAGDPTLDQVMDENDWQQYCLAYA